jgi:hypothetical protein
VASSDVQILAAGTASLPLTYEIPNAQQIIPLCVNARYDGSGAVVTWRPMLQIISDAGLIVGEIPGDTDIPAGGSANVTWFPFRKPRVPCPPCPPASYGVSLCGGVDSGPVASGMGDTTLTMTLARDVTCDCTIHVVAAGVTVGSLFPDVASVVTNVTDSLGATYDLSDSGAAQIGPVGQQSNVSTSRLILGPTAIRGGLAGGMHAGDTVTVTFHSDYPADFSSVGMVFAVANTTLPAIPLSLTGNIEYASSDQYDGIGTDPTTLSWVTDEGFAPAPVAVAGCIVASAAYPPAGTFHQLDGDLLGDITGALSLAVHSVSHVEAGGGIDPGGAWDNAAEALVANFQFITLTGA